MKNRPAIKRGYLLAGLAVLLTLLSMRFAFWNTVQAMKVNSQLSTRQGQAADLRYPAGYLERKVTNLDKIITKYKADTTTYRTVLLTQISSLAEKVHVKVIDVPTDGTAYEQTSHYKIQKIGLEGSFTNLTKFYNAFQDTSGIGIVRSANYFLLNQRTSFGNERRLGLLIYLETSK